MARSTYVYTVLDGRDQKGAFTVKHELVSAVHHWLLKGLIRRSDLRILRAVDGYMGSPVDITNQFVWGTA